MSDHADIADAKIFAVAARGLAAIRRRPVLDADCHCHFCDEAVAPEALFCDVDCRDDYDKEQDGLRRSGLR
jgi:hypothetical protein